MGTEGKEKGKCTRKEKERGDRGKRGIDRKGG